MRKTPILTKNKKQTPVSGRPKASAWPGLVTIKLITLLVMIGLLLVVPATPAFAQDGISSALGDIVTSITDIIQGLTVVVGILGLTLWGFAKVARPIFPELSQLTGQYVGQFVLGVVVVFVAATVVEEIASAVGG